MKDLIKKFKVPLKGVIHIGAHHGWEIETYNELGIKDVVFYEPLVSNYNFLLENVKTRKINGTNVICINKALGNITGEIEMFVETANQGQSSSILERMGSKLLVLYSTLEEGISYLAWLILV